MANKRDVKQKFPEFTEGLKVRSRDDESLGKIVFVSDDYFVIEKGLFFPKDFTVRYDDISDMRGDTVYLGLDKESLTDWREPGYLGWNQVDQINQGKSEAKPSDEYRGRFEKYQSAQTIGEQQTRIPLAEEQLEATKIVREVGGVQVRKIVHSELRHFTVPVMKEEIRVERVATPDREAMAPEQATFKEETITVPVHEEEIVIQKRPVVREEVRITKEQQQTEQEISGEVRKEDVEIKEHGVAEKKKKIA